MVGLFRSLERVDASSHDHHHQLLLLHSHIMLIHFNVRFDQHNLSQMYVFYPVNKKILFIFLLNSGYLWHVCVLIAIVFFFVTNFDEYFREKFLKLFSIPFTQMEWSSTTFCENAIDDYQVLIAISVNEFTICKQSSYQFLFLSLLSIFNESRII